MTRILSVLLHFVFNALRYLLGFLATLALGIVGATLYALPWLLRTLSVWVWLAAAFVGLQTLQTVYAPTISAIPLFALKFAVILLMVAWAIYAFQNGVQIWGTLAAGGLVVWLCAQGILWLAENWKYASLFLGMLPTLIFVVGIFSEAAHIRTKRKLRFKTIQPEIAISGGGPA